MAETIVVIERGLFWTAYFENAPHKKVRAGNRARAIGSLIESYGDHCGITIRVGTVEDEAVVTGTKTYADLQADLKAAREKANQLETDNEDLQAIIDQIDSATEAEQAEA